MPNKKKLALGLSAGLLLICLAGLWSWNSQRVKKNLQTRLQPSQITSIDYEKKYTGEDTQPLPVPPKDRQLKLPILMYHHIGEPPAHAGKIREDLTVSVEDFQQQMKWLKDHEYQSIKFSDLYKYTLGEIKLPKKPVIISFDDGYQDAFDNAVPILKAENLNGSFAIITQYPSTHSGTNFYVDWQEIKTAMNDGMEMVSHTQDHFDGKNPKYSEDFISNNLKGSISDIKDHLNFTTNVLIYPYGRYTPKYIELAKQAGFKLGITVHTGNMVNLDNLMEIPRVRIHRTTSLEQFAKAVGK